MAEQAKSIRIELDDDDLRAIALAEALPQNQPGADNAWVWQNDEASREEYRRVTRPERGVAARITHYALTALALVLADRCRLLGALAFSCGVFSKKIVHQCH